MALACGIPSPGSPPAVTPGPSSRVLIVTRRVENTRHPSELGLNTCIAVGGGPYVTDSSRVKSVARSIGRLHPDAVVGDGDEGAVDGEDDATVRGAAVEQRL